MKRLGGAGAPPDSINKLIKLLAEERKNFTSIEIAETLWLAMQMEPMAEVIPDTPSTSSLETDLAVSISLQGESQPDLLPPPPPPISEVNAAPTPQAGVANIAATAPQAGVLPPQVLPVWLADPPMLTDALAVIRALKPLLQKAEAGIGKRLDESTTVDNIASTHLWLPVLKSEQEPWFDIVLVVDRGSSMHIWHRLVKDVVRILRRYGAFRNVQMFDLVVNQGNQATSDVVQLISKPHRPSHRPSELIDQRGRRIVIVLSDCSGVYWWDGTLLPMLQDWGKIMPTVVWQMLPAWMWKRTALGRGTAVAISNDIPGTANQRLKTRIQERHKPEDADYRIPMPVVTSEVRDLARWSLMLAGNRREITPGFLLPQRGGSVPRSKGIEEIAQDRIKKNRDEGSDLDPDEAFNKAIETIARERVDRFLELASPQAQRLIMLLAAAPVITLPVVRLIRDAMLYEARSPLSVAEVFLSGLLLRLPGQEDRELERVLKEEREQAQASLDSQDLLQQESELEPMLLDQQDLVQYDFAPKVRQILLEVLPVVDTIEVINSVSAAVERRWNQISDEDFRAFLTNPNTQAPKGLEGLRSFASVTAEILEQLGGEYANLAQQLHQGTVEPKLKGNDDWLLEKLEVLEFKTAQIVEPDAAPAFPVLQVDQVEVVTIAFDDQSDDLQQIEFEVATLEYTTEQQLSGFLEDLLGLGKQSGQWAIRDQPRQAYQWVELLGDDLQLEMVAIPSGCFLMGSPEDEPERVDQEGPQHEVAVSGFFMGRYPVTQAQWRFVAALPHIDRNLDPDPSLFKGAKHPAENVSWYDAVEFCSRLSAHTGQEYRLPTEAEWEYACRAETTTPFHFGETITTDLANYDGGYTYNSGPKGEKRSKTTPVDHFKFANVFGLCDMHGNVWEWCEDHWHDNYEFAPTDGSAWLGEDNTSFRVLRGGSWLNYPETCRSACRGDNSPDSRLDRIGFRVVCSAPRTL